MELFHLEKHLEAVLLRPWPWSSCPVLEPNGQINSSEVSLSPSPSLRHHIPWWAVRWPPSSMAWQKTWKTLLMSKSSRDGSTVWMRENLLSENGVEIRMSFQPRPGLFHHFLLFCFEVYISSELINSRNILREVGELKAPDVYWLKPIKPHIKFPS